MRYCSILFFLLLLFNGVDAQPLPDLIPYRDNNKWGYADSTGRQVIAAQWDEAFFFHDGRAIVAFFYPGDKNHKFYCSITRKGEYIVPPTRHWTGTAGGWDALNCTDSNGRWGIIDSNNNVLLPCEWDAYSPQLDNMRDSFKVVMKGGYSGLINRQNEMVLPCKYAEIIVQPLLYKQLHAFVVSDPDNREGRNRFGVVGMNGNSILPMQYGGATYEEQGSKKGFRLWTSSDNDMQTYNNVMTRNFWIDYPSMKPGIAPVPDPQSQPVAQEELIGEHIFFTYNGYGGRYGVKDKKGKVLISCCEVERRGGDTVVRRTSATHGDSLVLTMNFLSKITLKPLCPPRVKFIYQRPIELDDYPRQQRSYGFANEGGLSIMVEGYDSKQIYKDSFLYDVMQVLDTQRITFGPVYYDRHWGEPVRDTKDDLYVLKGYVRNSGSYAYGAVVDAQLNYIIQPRRLAGIKAYNRQDDIITLADEYLGGAHGLVNRKGDTLCRFRAWQLTGGFRWHGKVYTCVSIPRPMPPPTKSQEGSYEYMMKDRYAMQVYDKVIADTGGVRMGKWKTFAVIGKDPMITFPNGELGFWAIDSTNMVSVLDPDGKVLLPALSGKYKQIKPFGGKCFFVVDSFNAGKIVDEHNTNILPEIKVADVTPANIGWKLLYGGAYKNGEPHPHLFRVQIAGGLQSFYFNDKGIAYQNRSVNKKEDEKTTRARDRNDR